MYNHAEVHLSLAYRKQREFIYCTTKNEITPKKMKKKSSKSIFYLAKWTDFTPDNTSLCDSITNDFTVQ